MHVLLIHQAFAGPDDPGGTRHFEIGRALVANGHRMTIIAGATNYLTGAASTAGSGSLPDGMRIVRVGGSAEIHRSYWARGKGFVSFALGALSAARRIEGVDVVWGTSPPLVQLLPAWLASRRAPGGLVFEERDLWPEFAIGMGIVRDGALARGALALKRFMYARARRIVINSPGFLPFLRRHGVPDDKVRIVPNGVDVTQFDPGADGRDARREWNADGRFVVLYAGALGPANGLEVVLDAARTLSGTPALFVLVGDGKARPALEHAARERALENVVFVPAQPKARIPALLAGADACLATLRDIPLFRTTYPNKVFDYMAAGRAVLLGIDGVIRDVVEEANAGRFFPPGDPDALAAAVVASMRERDETRAMGQRGRAAVCARFDRRVHAAQIETLFAELSEPTDRPHGAPVDRWEERPPAVAMTGRG